MPDVQVVRSVGCSDGDEPDPSVADQAPVDSSRGRIRDGQQRRRSGRGAEGASVGVEERGAGRFVAGGVIAESGAAAGGEVGECSGGIVAEIVVKGFGDDVRAGEVLPYDQRGGDDEDEALGEPEDGEDFQEEATHLGSASCESAAKDELVARAANGLHAVVVGRISCEFTAQAADVHVEAAIEGIEFSAEHGLSEGLALDNFSRRAHEDFEQGELDVGEFDEGVVLANGAGGGIEDQVFDDEGGGFVGCDGRGGATADGADAGEQLAGVEGLGEVVVGTHLEADDAVDVFAAGGEEKDAVGGRGADAFEDFEAVDAGEHDVEEDHGPGAGARGFEAGVAAVDGVDAEVVAGEVLGEHVAELDVVVNEEDVFHGRVAALVLAHVRVTRSDARWLGNDVMIGHCDRDKVLQRIT